MSEEKKLYDYSSLEILTHIGWTKEVLKMLYKNSVSSNKQNDKKIKYILGVKFGVKVIF